MSAPDAAGAPPSESKKPVRLLVVGDSDFASEEYLQLSRYVPIYQDGAQMLFNAIGWTTEDEALTPVRTKTLTARPIQIESPGTALALQVVNIAGVPAAFVGIRRRALAPPPRAPSGPETLTLRLTSGSNAMNRKTLLALAVFAGLGMLAIIALTRPEKGERSTDRARPSPS